MGFDHHDITAAGVTGSHGAPTPAAGRGVRPERGDLQVSGASAASLSASDSEPDSEGRGPCTASLRKSAQPGLPVAFKFGSEG